MAERVMMLIDGHSLVYRGFYALQDTRPFTNAKGELTTGVYAFTSMLLKAIEDLKPQFAAAAFDMSRPTFRLNEFAAYKGTRTSAPPGLRDQVTWSRRVLESMQIPMFEVEGYEADDVLGALSVKAVAQGPGRHHPERRQRPAAAGQPAGESADLAPRHLGHDHLRRGQSHREVRRPAARPGARLQGACAATPTDNIPGVAGIGDKGAQKLLLEFGTVAGRCTTTSSRTRCPTSSANCSSHCAIRCCWPGS